MAERIANERKNIKPALWFENLEPKKWMKMFSISQYAREFEQKAFPSCHFGAIAFKSSSHLLNQIQFEKCFLFYLLYY